MNGFSGARVLGCLVSGCLVSGCLVSACVILLAAGQDPQRPIFRAKADAVTLDVTVVDKSGRPVNDLRAADFEVIEQGKPQTIEAFQLVDMDQRPPMESNLYHDVRTMESLEQEIGNHNSRLIVIFLDEYHILPSARDSYQAEQQVRIQLSQYVRELDPRDLVAIMYPLTPVTGLSFSRDHDADARIIAKFEGRQGEYFPPKNRIEERQLSRLGEIEKIRADVVRTALQGLATFLGTTRDTRKQVLLATTWVPGGMSGFALDDFKQIQRAAARGNTAFYPWDPRGLLAGSSLAAHEWFHVLAEQTGGRAIVNTNDGVPGMRAMLRDSSAYYLIGYTSTENARDGKFHEVKVKVKRSGLELRAKPGYWAYDADAIERSAAPVPPPVDAEVNAALEAAEAPEQGRPMLTWAGFDRDDTGATTVSVVFEPHDTRTPIDHADIVAVSDTASFRGVSKNVVSFPAKPGDLSIRIAAVATDGSPVETGFVALTVPKPAPVILATPKFIKGRNAREVTAAAAIPTASREFTKLDQVVVRVHAWTTSGAEPALSLRLLSDHGEVLQDLAPQTAGVFPIPVGGLGLGRYVIEITATDGTASAKALAAFRVK